MAKHLGSCYFARVREARRQAAGPGAACGCEVGEEGGGRWLDSASCGWR